MDLAKVERFSLSALARKGAMHRALAIVEGRGEPVAFTRYGKIVGYLVPPSIGQLFTPGEAVAPSPAHVITERN